jgi:D-sedoheptulose 7-phosphate isomerase
MQNDPRHRNKIFEQAAKAGRRIYVVGNGGSAAIADHLCCDWTKGTNASGHPVIKTTSLSSNVALYSAVANDYGFEQVFSTQVEFFGEPGDVLVAISSSGNSPNIISAVQMAKVREMAAIGLSGFGGGRLAQEASVSLHVPFENYGIVEDAHQAIMHILAQFIVVGRDLKK